jgi:hypothetical protein
MPAPLTTRDLSPKEKVQVELHNAVVDERVNEEEAIGIIRRCIKAGANPNCYDECTFLDTACQSGRFRVVEELLKQGARLDFVGPRFAADRTSVLHMYMIKFTFLFYQRKDTAPLLLILKYDKKNHFGTLATQDLGTPKDLLDEFFKEMEARPHLVADVVDYPEKKREMEQVVEEHMSRHRASPSSWRDWLPFWGTSNPEGYQLLAHEDEDAAPAPAKRGTPEFKKNV